MEIIQSIVGFFIAIGILVTFHEYGHFIIARMFNVTVLNFSIRFGKSVYKYQPTTSNTEYSIGLIPLGGYVKMLESEELEKTDKKNKFYDEKYCFDKQKVWKRFLIVAAGPIFNLILAFIFFIFVHMSGMNGLKPLIDSVDNIDDPIFLIYLYFVEYILEMMNQFLLFLSYDLFQKHLVLFQSLILYFLHLKYWLY